jgi:diguanylate cyclase (GGDEF)-like protein
MLALDHTPRIRWMNPALEKMLELSAEALIGKDKASLPAELHALFDETDVLHLALNGHGERWLQRDVCEAQDTSQRALRIHFYQDISRRVSAEQETEKLRQKVEELTVIDELTGLANHRATLQALAVQVTRTRRYGNPLTLGAIEISHPEDSGMQLADATILSFSHYLRERLRWADTLGRFDDQLFLLVMPETKENDAIVLLTKIRDECQTGALRELPDKSPAPRVEISASAWLKGDDPQRLVHRTLASLKQ